MKTNINITIMKNIIKSLILILVITIIPRFTYSQGGLPAYYKLDSINGNIDAVSKKIKSNLEKNSFRILGTYKPARKKNLEIITFTHSKLTEIALEIGDRSLPASVLRIGIRHFSDKNNQIVLLNPDYLFYGYFREGIENHELILSSISNMVKISLQKMGGIIQPQGKASWSENELKYFRILVNYPSFEEPIILNEFASFDEGLETIQKNLQARKGNAVKVYQQIFKDKKTAVFGIGLLDPNRGETTFLKALGEDNIAALPYEIILEDNKASILDGKFWFPFYWSNLSMKELKAIRRVPNDVEYIMKGLTKK